MECLQREDWARARGKFTHILCYFHPCFISVNPHLNYFLSVSRQDLGQSLKQILEANVTQPQRTEAPTNVPGAPSPKGTPASRAVTPSYPNTRQPPRAPDPGPAIRRMGTARVSKDGAVWTARPRPWQCSDLHKTIQTDWR